MQEEEKSLHSHSTAIVAEEHQSEIEADLEKGPDKIEENETKDENYDRDRRDLQHGSRLGIDEKKHEVADYDTVEEGILKTTDKAEPQDEDFKVTWESPEDPTNPQNWGVLYRWE
jgi:hypothetical protein